MSGKENNATDICLKERLLQTEQILVCLKTFHLRTAEKHLHNYERKVCGPDKLSHCTKARERYCQTSKENIFLIHHF